MEKKIVVMIYTKDKMPKDNDWTSAIILDEAQHDEAYNLLCDLQERYF